MRDPVRVDRGPVAALASFVAELRGLVGRVPEIKYGQCVSVDSAGLATVSFPTINATTGAATTVSIAGIRCVGEIPSTGDAVVMLDSGNGRIMVIGTQRTALMEQFYATGGSATDYTAAQWGTVPSLTLVQETPAGYYSLDAFAAPRAGVYHTDFSLKLPVAATYRVEVGVMWGAFQLRTLGRFVPSMISVTDDPIVHFGFTARLATGQSMDPAVKLTSTVSGLVLGNTWSVSRIGD